LQQLCEAVDARTSDRFQPWRQKLADGEAKKRLHAGGNYPTDGEIHPCGCATRSKISCSARRSSRSTARRSLISAR